MNNNNNVFSYVNYHETWLYIIYGIFKNICDSHPFFGEMAGDWYYKVFKTKGHYYFFK